jgi:signal transduction histidine kinase/DNA-binding response OmpR family regulator
MQLHKLISVLFVLCTQQAISQGGKDSVYIIESRYKLHDLAPFVSIFTDESNKIGAAEILSGKFDAQFVSIDSVVRGEPYVSYWLKFKIRSKDSLQDWWLMFRSNRHVVNYDSQNCYIDVYVTDENRQLTQHQRSGIFVPRSAKSVKGVAGLNRALLRPAKGQTQILYVRLYNEYDAEGVAVFPELHDPSLPLPERSYEMLLYLLIGITAIFTVLSLFFFFFVREVAYLFFAIYTFLLWQHYLLLHPDLPFIDWYIPEYPSLSVPLFNLLATHVFIFFLWFGRYFINLGALSRRLDTFLKYFLIAWSSLVVIESVLMAIYHRYVLTDYIVFTCMPLTLFFVIRVAFFKNALVRFYVAGALWLFVFAGLGFLQDVGLTLPFNPWPIGQAGQLVIFSIGLAYKIRLNEKARAEGARIKEMDEIKSKFFANISHEFRTPLTLIQGPLKQIEENAAGKDGSGTVNVPARHLTTMRRNTDRLLELVNQLLDLSKLDSGKMKLQVMKGDVLQLLKALSYSFESMAERKQIHYHVHFPEKTIIGWFDKDKLEKIVTNLLSNAFKYTPEKGTVGINIEADDKRLRFTVEDSGHGIGKKELDKIFDRFYQVEGTEDKGSGIGLALVKELTELYRGQISVSSEPGKGSRFKISLPLEYDAFGDEERVSASNIDAGIARPVVEDIVLIPSNGKEDKSGLPLVLVVEDNAELRQFIKECLQTHFQLAEAPDGLKGLQAAVDLIPDIVVSDVMMPGMDGFLMTERLKRDERTSHIPVILLTAKAGQQHKISGLETGADDYLTKPFDAKELLVRIQNLVDQRKLLRKKFAGTIQLKPTEVTSKSIDEVFLGNVMRAIENNMDEDEFGVEDLAKEVAMSRSQLHRKLVALVDKSPSDLIRQTRLLRAKELLEKKIATPSEVAFKVGFASHTYFSKCFKEEFGISPSEV